MIFGALALAACRGAPAVDRRLDAIARGAAFLATQQRVDGAVPSRVQGLLRSGHTTTPLAIRAWQEAAAAGVETPAIDRALAWLVAMARPVVGLPGSVVEYPVYATSLALSALAAAGHDTALPQQWLLGQQLAGPAWADHPGHGGFPLGGRTPPDPAEPVHVDLSMTRHAVEGLRAAGTAADHPAIAAAAAFTARCAARDEGYVYSPTEREANKAGCDDSGCAGYGTPTADAARILHAAADSAGAAKAAAQLAAMHDPLRNPRLADGPMPAFASAMRYCYRATAAPVLARHGGPPGWRDALIDALVAEQATDGSWRNASPLQKEDCPVVATSLALLALGAAGP